MAIKREKNGLKKIMFLNVIFLLSVFGAYSQNGEPKSGGRFIKKIEYNRFAWGSDNLDSKKSGEKQLLGEFNAPVEFYFAPLYEKPENPAAFRIVRDSLANVYNLFYSTYKNVETRDVNDEILIRSFTVSNQFAEKMYNNMVLLIDNAKARGTQLLVIHGYEVTFRAVVEDEVWSLTIHMPFGDALKMSDLCRQIIDDADNDKLNEAKYIKILDDFDFERRKTDN